MKRKFTDRWVRSIKPAPPGKRVEYYDTMTPCFGVRVTDRMIAHNGGMHAVYDLHTYEAEKRQGFGLWNARLRGILAAEPAESNVVPIRG
jgi:hypothetical protein